MKNIIQKTKLAIFGLLILCLGILAIPEFTLDVFGRNVSFPGIGFSRIGIPVDYGNMSLGEGFVGSESFFVVFTDASGNELPEDQIDKSIEIIQNRLSISGVTDVELKPASRNGQNGLVINLPKTIADRQSYLGWVLSTGKISFVDSQNNTILSQQNFFNGNIQLTTLNFFGTSLPALEFNLDESVLSALSPYIAAQSLYLQVDGVDEIWNVWDARSLYIIKTGEQPAQEQTFSTTKTAITPLFTGQELGSLTNIAKVVRGYFLEQGADVPFSGFQIISSNDIAPENNVESVTFVSIVFLICLIFLFITNLKTLGFGKTFQIGILYTYVMLIFINVLKLFGAVINYQSYIIIILVSLVLFDLSKRILVEQNSEFKSFINKFSLAIILIVAIYIYVIPNGSFLDIFGIFAASAVCIYLGYSSYRILGIAKS